MCDDKPEKCPDCGGDYDTCGCEDTLDEGIENDVYYD